MSGNDSLLGAIRGPILLIVLGSLLAFDQAGRYSFSRTWPVLVILFGIFWFAERLGEHHS